MLFTQGGSLIVEGFVNHWLKWGTRSFLAQNTMIPIFPVLFCRNLTFCLNDRYFWHLPGLLLPLSMVGLTEGDRGDSRSHNLLLNAAFTSLAWRTMRCVWPAWHIHKQIYKWNLKEKIKSENAICCNFRQSLKPLVEWKKYQTKEGFLAQELSFLILASNSTAATLFQVPVHLFLYLQNYGFGPGNF